MLSAIRKNQSLTFYQPTTISSHINSSYYQEGIQAEPLTENIYRTSSLTTKYNSQLHRYLQYNYDTQKDILSKTNDFIKKKIAKDPTLSNSKLRDSYRFHKYVRPFVTRQELMKLQVGAKVRLPLPKYKIDQIKAAIADKDLTNTSDSELTKIIDDICSPNKDIYMTALKNFQKTGKVSRLLKKSALEKLREELKGLDLDNISKKKFQSIVKKYCEGHEYHHRTSVSANPYKQSVADNIEIDNGTQHDRRHTHPNKDGTKKLNYTTPTKLRKLNRNKELKIANKKRVHNNEVTGIKSTIISATIIGFSIGFIARLAQSGIQPSSIKYAFLDGARSGIESGALGGASYGLGRTIGQNLVKAATGMLKNAGMQLTENISQMLSMGIVGTLTISVFSTYQFVKLKIKGVGTKEAFIQVGKQALFSLSILAASIIAQGAFGGVAGIVVSTSVGLVIIVYSFANCAHQRKISSDITEYMINKCKPVILGAF